MLPAFSNPLLAPSAAARNTRSACVILPLNLLCIALKSAYGSLRPSNMKTVAYHIIPRRDRAWYCYIRRDTKTAFPCFALSHIEIEYVPMFLLISEPQSKPISLSRYMLVLRDNSSSPDSGNARCCTLTHPWK